jgi:hypothetical protein
MTRDTPSPEVDRASVLDAWDEAILTCFAEIRHTPSLERTPCTVRLSQDCLRCLDETLATLRGANRSRPGSDGELWALRSAAIEVATRSYVGGVRGRRRGALAYPRRGSAWERESPPAATNTATAVEVVVCALPRDLLMQLDALAPGRGRPPARELVPGDQLVAARSVVVESAVTAWLILRGYSTVAPSGRRHGLLAMLRQVLRRASPRL